MKHRTVEEGRELVRKFNDSVESRAYFARSVKVKPHILSYWIRRVQKLDKTSVKNTFVEISVPQKISKPDEAARITARGVDISIVSLPPAVWMAELLGLLEQ